MDYNYVTDIIALSLFV